MKIKSLMLGWEFPPYISGGLGTACYGLTKAMGRLGMEVTFLLPRMGPVRVGGSPETVLESGFPHVRLRSGVQPARVWPLWQSPVGPPCHRRSRCAGRTCRWPRPLRPQYLRGGPPLCHARDEDRRIGRVRRDPRPRLDDVPGRDRGGGPSPASRWSSTSTPRSSTAAASTSTSGSTTSSARACTRPTKIIAVSHLTANIVRRTATACRRKRSRSSTTPSTSNGHAASPRMLVRHRATRRSCCSSAASPCRRARSTSCTPPRRSWR